MDRVLYFLQGQMAVAYGGGIHTKHRHTEYHRFFAERVGRGDRILDLGCGNGALAADVATQCQALVFGVDWNFENIQKACRRHSQPGVFYCVGDAFNPCLSGSFDVIILSNILEHLKNRSTFLTRLQEHSCPTRILIRVPVFERDWRVPLKKELGVEWRLDPTHETEYTIESFSKEMQEARLEILHQEVRWGEIWAEVAPVSKSQSPVVEA